jgi:hypothetical protein
VLVLQLPLLGVAVAVTSSLAALRTWTTTWVVSLAFPLKDGFVSFDGELG